MSSDRLVLGLDLGAGSAKAVVLDPEFGPLGHGAGCHAVDIPRPGWAQQDPEQWWRSCVEAVHAAIANAGVAGKAITALAVSGLGAALVALDADGVPLYPALTGLDARAGQEAAYVRGSAAGAAIRRATGADAAAWNIAAKLVWLRTHEADVVRRARLITSASGFLLRRMTGEDAISVSDAGISDLFDLGERDWAAGTVNALDLDCALLPQIYPSRAVVGQLTTYVADELGLSAGCAVVAGGEDTSSAALAMGVFAPGAAFVSLGTSAVTGLCRAAGRPGHPQLLTFPHVIPGVDLVVGSMSSAGAAVTWLAGVTNTAPAVLLSEAAMSPPGARGLDFLPYLAGELHPINDPNARAVFAGLSLAHGRADLARAVVEASAAAIAHNQSIALAGRRPDSITITGGPSRSDLWCQSISDATGVTVDVVDSGSAELGDAILADTECDPYELVRRHRRVTARYEPDRTRADEWANRRGRLDALYAATRTVAPGQLVTGGLR